ncbi:MAG: TIM barrel protein [Candidatus Firestonebacteria bacterium]
MKIDAKNLKKIKTEYSGYIEGNGVDKFFKEFGINFAAGHWAAGDFCDRFAPSGYNSNNPNFSSGIISQIERIAKAGIKGIEFHEAVFIDEKHKKDKIKINAVKNALIKNKLVPTNMNINLFTDPKWKFGGITNIDPKIKKDALEVALQGVEIAKEVGCESVALWPGSDGWDYNFEVNHQKLLESFIEGCIQINKKAKSLGLRFGIEAKLKEPREGNMVLSTSHLALLVAKVVNRECGGDNMGICIDYGHEQMYGVEPASVVYAAKMFNTPLINFHLNNAKYKSNDEDRIAGTGDNWRFAEFCYAAIDTGYAGWFGEDQFTYRTEPIKSMALSRELFANVMKKALQIYADKKELEKAQAKADATAVIDVVKKILI